MNQGTDLRFEADHNVVARRPGKGDIPPFFGRAESKLVFVRHGDEVRSLETGVPIARDQFVTNAFKIDLSGFSPEVQERITGPFATLVEFDLLNAGTELVVERGTYQGDPVLVLRTKGGTRISDSDQVEFATFFVQPESCLVVRMEQHSEEIATGHCLEFEGDFAYTPGVLVRPGAFFLKLPPDAVDLIELPIAAHGRGFPVSDILGVQNLTLQSTPACRRREAPNEVALASAVDPQAAGVPLGCA